MKKILFTAILLLSFSFSYSQNYGRIENLEKYLLIQGKYFRTVQYMQTSNGGSIYFFTDNTVIFYPKGELTQNELLQIKTMPINKMAERDAYWYLTRDFDLRVRFKDDTIKDYNYAMKDDCCWTVINGKNVK